MALEVKGISNVRALNKSKKEKKSNKVVKAKASTLAKTKPVTKNVKGINTIKMALEEQGISSEGALKKLKNMKPKTSISANMNTITQNVKSSNVQETSNIRTKPVKSVKTSKSTMKMKSKETLEAVKDKTSMSKDDIKIGLETLFNIIEKSDDSKELEADKIKIQLHLTNIQVPKCPLRTIRIHIPHCIIPETMSSCLIVSDIKKDGRFDDTTTINYYEDLLRSQHVSNIPAIIPMHVLKTKYNNFEIKRQLMNQYDTFLVDVRVSGLAFHIIGKTLKKKNKCLYPLKFEVPNIKFEILKTLRRTKIMLHAKGYSSCIEVGHANMKREDIAHNVLVVVKWLVDNYPGGLDNIRCLALKTASSSPVPLYWSTTDKDEVKQPIIRNNKRKLVKTINNEYLSKKGAKIRVKGDKIFVQKSDGWKEVPNNRTEEESDVEESEIDETEVDSEMKIYL